MGRTSTSPSSASGIRAAISTARSGLWHSSSMYWPYKDSDRFDGFWGAKILIRFTREQLAVIQSFDPVLLNPHGGDLQGFFLIKG